VGFFPEVKQPGSEVDRSPAFGAKVENVWSYTFSPFVCLHGMAGKNLYLHFFVYLIMSCSATVIYM
jgi:hypothetical protein